MVTVVCGKEVTVIECAIGGLPKCAKFIRIGDTFQGCWLLLISMIVPTQKYGQLIIQSLSCLISPERSEGEICIIS